MQNQHYEKKLYKELELLNIEIKKDPFVFKTDNKENVNVLLLKESFILVTDIKNEIILLF